MLHGLFQTFKEVRLSQIFPDRINRHRTFRLRLPSIRRDIKRKAKGSQTQDPENPQETETVPLNQIPECDQIVSDEESKKNNLTKQEVSNLSNLSKDSNLNDKNELVSAVSNPRASHSSLNRRASSLENVDSSSKTSLTEKHARKAATLSAGRLLWKQVVIAVSTISEFIGTIFILNELCSSL